MKPIYLLRYGLPIATAVAGIVIIVVGSGEIATTAGVVVIGVAFMVFIANVLARLTISSQDDRDREQEARETFIREGHWPSAHGRGPNARR